MLVQGPSAWDAFVEIALSPPFLALDVPAPDGELIHAFNAFRVG